MTLEKEKHPSREEEKTTQMTSIYPTQPNPTYPPTYEQATYYPQAPPIPSMFGMYSTSPTVLQPQAPPIDMYATPPKDFQPPMGMYTPSGMDLPPQRPPIGTHMLITTQAMMYGDMPIQCICPHCRQPIVTRIEKPTGLVSWLLCGGILLLGGWLGCCLIPFCIDGLKDTEHYCPNCAVLLGARKRM